MKIVAAEQAEQEAARNWCAGVLTGAGEGIEGNVAKRWVKIGVESLLDVYKDGGMSDAEKLRRCKEAYDKSMACPDHPYPSICVVDGEEYGLCTKCPLRVEEP